MCYCPLMPPSCIVFLQKYLCGNNACIHTYKCTPWKQSLHMTQGPLGTRLQGFQEYHIFSGPISSGNPWDLHALGICLL